MEKSVYILMQEIGERFLHLLFNYVRNIYELFPSIKLKSL
jgi:hypothetical protein